MENKSFMKKKENSKRIKEQMLRRSLDEPPPPTSLSAAERRKLREQSRVRKPRVAVSTERWRVTAPLSKCNEVLNPQSANECKSNGDNDNDPNKESSCIFVRGSYDGQIAAHCRRSKHAAQGRTFESYQDMMAFLNTVPEKERTLWRKKRIQRTYTVQSPPPTAKQAARGATKQQPHPQFPAVFKQQQPPPMPYPAGSKHQQPAYYQVSPYWQQQYMPAPYMSFQPVQKSTPSSSEEKEVPEEEEETEEKEEEDEQKEKIPLRTTMQIARAAPLHPTTPSSSSSSAPEPKKLSLLPDPVYNTLIVAVKNQMSLFAQQMQLGAELFASSSLQNTDQVRQLRKQAASQALGDPGVNWTSVYNQLTLSEPCGRFTETQQNRILIGQELYLQQSLPAFIWLDPFLKCNWIEQSSQYFADAQRALSAVSDEFLPMPLPSPLVWLRLHGYNISQSSVQLVEENVQQEEKKRKEEEEEISSGGFKPLLSSGSSEYYEQGEYGKNWQERTRYEQQHEPRPHGGSSSFSFPSSESQPGSPSSESYIFSSS
jgi:hypothetical protein